MGKGRKSAKKHKLTARQQRVKAWEKERKRILRWAKSQANRGLFPELPAIVYQPTPARIYQRDLNRLQSLRGSKLRQEIPLQAKDADVAIFANVPMDRPLTYDEVKRYTKTYREYHSPDNIGIALLIRDRAKEILSHGENPEVRRAYYLIDELDDVELISNMLSAPKGVIELAEQIVYDSNQWHRQQALSEFISIVYNRSLSAVELQNLALGGDDDETFSG